MRHKRHSTLASGTRRGIHVAEPPHPTMRLTCILTFAVLGLILFPQPALAVKPWRSGFAAHPTSLPIGTQLDARRLKETQLSPTPRHGPIGHSLSRGDKLKRYVTTPPKRGGGRASFDPFRGARRSAAAGRLPQYNRVRPHTELGRLPSTQRPRYFTAPH